MIHFRTIALGVALAAAGSAAAAQDPAFLPVPLKKIAQDTRTDPLGIWSDREVKDVVAGSSNIYAGSIQTPRGTIVISQLVGRGFCDTPQDCPVRVVLQMPGGDRTVLISSEQLCSSPDFYAIRRDLKALRACDRVIQLP
ncbi:hypothetical protein E9232_006361 [Inquilinus ginsengisoli]|uniref:Uncharacterized protein n=1 Tax=Inquilinus ginsengisoli TaxID=363840 RepID=A0ABU1JYW3_9PROT|nr:hypothetical protein [Inquilinus ginsengisoli]MDR6293808.1 hypothetical protein [Inquilinus ginsengisoli]